MKKFLLSLAVCAAANAATVGISLPFQQQFLSQLAPELKTVLLVPEGADPHTFEPRPSQMAAFEQAKIYLAIGVESEELWLPKILAKSTPVIRTDAAVSKQNYAPAPSEFAELEHHHDHHGHHDHDHHDHGHHGHHDHHDHDHHDHHDHHHAHHHHHDHSGLDVHVWTSPHSLAAIAAATSAAIAEHFPELAAAQPERLAALQAALSTADARYKKTLAGLKTRGFIDSHPSFGYFATHYGLREFSLEIEGKELHAAELAALKKLAAAKKACLMLTAPQFNTKLSKVLQNETNLPQISINPLAPDIISELDKLVAALEKHCK